MGVKGSMNKNKGKADMKKNVQQAPSTPRCQDNAGSMSMKLEALQNATY